MQLRPEYLDAIKGVKWETELPEQETKDTVPTVAPGDPWQGGPSVVHELDFPEYQPNPLAADIGKRLVAGVDALGFLGDLAYGVRYGAHHFGRLAPKFCGQLSHTYPVGPPLNHEARYDALVMVHAGTWEKARASAAEGHDAARAYLTAMIARGLFELRVDEQVAKTRTQKRLEAVEFIRAFGHLEDILDTHTKATIAAAGDSLEFAAELEAAQADPDAPAELEAV